MKNVYIVLNLWLDVFLYVTKVINFSNLIFFWKEWKEHFEWWNKFVIELVDLYATKVK